MKRLAPGWRHGVEFAPVSTGAAVDNFAESNDDASRSRRPILIAGTLVRGTMCIALALGGVLGAVSYTHLTLPTILRV